MSGQQGPRTSPLPCGPLFSGPGGFLPTMQAKNQSPSRPRDSLSPNDVHSKAQCVLHGVGLALCREWSSVHPQLAPGPPWPGQALPHHYLGQLDGFVELVQGTLEVRNLQGPAEPGPAFRWTLLFLPPRPSLSDQEVAQRRQEAELLAANASQPTAPRLVSACGSAHSAHLQAATQGSHRACPLGWQGLRGEGQRGPLPTGDPMGLEQPECPPDPGLLTCSPNFCCSSACFPMCSWTEDTALLTEGDTPAPPHPAPTPAAPSRGPQLRSSRSSSGPASSSPSGSGPAVRQCRGSPRRGRPLCSNPPPGGRDGLQVGDWEEARSGPSP